MNQVLPDLMYVPVSIKKKDNASLKSVTRSPGKMMILLRSIRPSLTKAILSSKNFSKKRICPQMLML